MQKRIQELFKQLIETHEGWRDKGMDSQGLVGWTVCPQQNTKGQWGWSIKTLCFEVFWCSGCFDQEEMQSRVKAGAMSLAFSDWEWKMITQEWRGWADLNLKAQGVMHRALEDAQRKKNVFEYIESLKPIRGNGEVVSPKSFEESRPTNSDAWVVPSMVD